MKRRSPRSSSKPRNRHNWHRALRANVALNAYLAGVTDDNEQRDVICDLVADLGHLCDKECLDFETLVEMALVHWRSERQEVQP